MKKHLHILTFLLISVFVLVSGQVTAQDYEASKTLNKSVNAPSGVVIDMKNHSGDLKFVIGDDNTVSIKTEVHVNAKSEEDATKLLEAIEDFKFDLEGNRLIIDTRFYTTMNTINNKTTMVLINKDKIRLKDFEISHEVHIPKNAQLELENKYSHVILPDMNGKVKLNLYSGKMTAADFNSDLELTAKYSKITAGHFNANTDFELYDTDIRFKTSNNIEINSKYSKVEADKTGTFESESFNDKFYIDEIGALKLNAKYSDLESKAALSQLKLDLYDCNITVQSAHDMEFNGKYSKLKLGDVKSVRIDDMYDSNLTFGKTGQIEIGKSKYSEFYMDENSKFSIEDSYDDNVQIGKLNNDFSGVSINGKYTKLNIDAGTVPFKIDAAMKYGKVELPSTFKLTKQIEKNSEMEMEGGTGSPIMIRGYDNTVIIR